MARQGTKPIGETFDYIVVGAGSSGSVIAARLSQNGASVLVIEAGPAKVNAVSRIPGFHKVAWNFRPFNWSFVSEPEANLGGRRIQVPRGKVIGGSSAINGMAFLRGSPLDFDAWAQSGAHGWSYDDVLPYFRKSETSWNDDVHRHGHDGPVRVVVRKGSHQFLDEIAQAAQQAGYPTTQDPDGDFHEGVSPMPQNSGGGVRNGTNSVYLEPALRSGNCRLIANALAKRVLFEGKRAVGIEYEAEGALHNALAAKEVILCGGAYNSPQLLMLSGIGNAGDLRAMGIEPLVDLPGVGANLQEHPMVYIDFGARESLLSTLRMDRMALALGRWMIGHGGALAGNGVSGNVLLRTLPELDRPDIQIMLTTIRSDAQPWLLRRQSHKWTWPICLLHPFSRGSVTLKSPDFRDHPAIRFNMFDDPRDMETMIRGIRSAQRIAGQPGLSHLLTGPMAPGPEVATDGELEAFIRQHAEITHHPVGTCRMGQDELAVVDPTLQVSTVSGLRVADASVIPLVPGANTNPAAIMIGERASDLILGRSA
ncbi:GMC family oxidoreductase [Novosphingobium pentaromativorans]|uniref:Glucose-methanol-choline oxidoreductase N-terminal domain-containing protein n=1 Tax=Novosphingobium pentaromativorans US6-1 TaxID=1088721 RepID=G6EGL4_9SPHN|nr:GMC family oxidoreductase N-terminal domain-containing protein [Novosphingobium pentaromativorans]AIT82158.1 hypothetical protein JI59_21775 [Novosphingobium pentaromativorans US6-1]EHJ59561.1 hypothetical protein NSU_3444 [Novosphingobium pentaromativorans US6-1]